MAGVLNILLARQEAGAAPFANGYYFRKKITIDHTKVGSTLTDYPLLFSTTDSVLKTTGNGGKITSSSGYDIRFETTGGTQLDHEVELWDGTTGAFVAHVRIPSLSATTDTELYIYYNNSSISSSEEHVTSVWSSDYKMVNHMATNPKNGDLSDSTSNANDLTPAGTFLSTSLVAGVVGNAVEFSGSHFVETINNIDVSGGNDRTISFWTKKSNTNNRNAVGYGGWATDQLLDILFYGGKIGGHFYTHDSVTSGSAPSYSANTWYHVAVTYGSGAFKIYINGTYIFSYSVTLNTVNSVLRVGSGSYSAYNDYEGIIDEVRVSDVVKSAGFITTEYNNMNSPSSFYAIGLQQHN